MGIFFFTKNQYYANGNHKCSSASRDMVEQFYDLVAPTQFQFLTPADIEVINQITLQYRVYIQSIRLIAQERGNKTLNQDIRFKLAQLIQKEKESGFVADFTIPQGEVLTVEQAVSHELCEWSDEAAREMYHEIVFPFTHEDLVRDLDEKMKYYENSIQEEIEESFVYLTTEVGDLNYHLWALKNLKKRVEG